LTQVHNHTNAEGESKQEIHYFHCDQIGITREQTDQFGNPHDIRYMLININIGVKK
jgi:rhs-related protein